MDYKQFFPQGLRDDDNINMLKSLLIGKTITTSAANNVKKLIVGTIEKTCAGHSIEQRKEDFETFLFLIDENGPKQGTKLYKEYIKDRTGDFIKFFERFPPTYKEEV